MKIVTIVANNPKFIELQYISIKKFISNDIEFIVFNDAKGWPDSTNFGDVEIKTQIKNTCEKLGIKCIDIPNKHHITMNIPSMRHADSLRFLTNFMIENPDIYLNIDSDMFFIDYFNLENYEKYDFCYTEQLRTNFDNTYLIYPWGNFFYINMNNIENKGLINWDCAPGGDTGSANETWLKSLDKNKCLKFYHLCSCQWEEKDIPENINSNIKFFLNNDIRNQNNKYFAEIYCNKILHYRAGSNWMNQSRQLHENLTNLLEKTIISL